MLRRASRRRRNGARWAIDQGPLWENGIGQLVIEGRQARVLLERSAPGEAGQPTLTTVHDIDLTG